LDGIASVHVSQYFDHVFQVLLRVLFIMFVGILVYRVSYVSSLKTCHFSYEDGIWLLHMLVVLVVCATADRLLRMFEPWDLFSCNPASI